MPHVHYKPFSKVQRSNYRTEAEKHSSARKPGQREQCFTAHVLGTHMKSANTLKIKRKTYCHNIHTRTMSNTTAAVKYYAVVVFICESKKITRKYLNKGVTDNILVV